MLTLLENQTLEFLSIKHQLKTAKFIKDNFI